MTGTLPVPEYVVREHVLPRLQVNVYPYLDNNVRVCKYSTFVGHCFSISEN